MRSSFRYFVGASCMAFTIVLLYNRHTIPAHLRSYQWNTPASPVDKDKLRLMPSSTSSVGHLTTSETADSTQHLSIEASIEAFIESSSEPPSEPSVESSPTPLSRPPSIPAVTSKVIVIAKKQDEDTSWVHEHLPGYASWTSTNDFPLT